MGTYKKDFTSHNLEAKSDLSISKAWKINYIQKIAYG